jgi:hypothetical protein
MNTSPSTTAVDAAAAFVNRFDALYTNADSALGAILSANDLSPHSRRVRERLTQNRSGMLEAWAPTDEWLGVTVLLRDGVLEYTALVGPFSGSLVLLNRCVDVRRSEDGAAAPQAVARRFARSMPPTRHVLRVECDGETTLKLAARSDADCAAWVAALQRVPSLSPPLTPMTTPVATSAADARSAPRSGGRRALLVPPPLSDAIMSLVAHDHLAAMSPVVLEEATSAMLMMPVDRALQIAAELLKGCHNAEPRNLRPIPSAAATKSSALVAAPAPFVVPRGGATVEAELLLRLMESQVVQGMHARNDRLLKRFDPSPAPPPPAESSGWL